MRRATLAPNPVPTKAMMRALGQPAGQCRLPMGDAPEGLEKRAIEVYEALNRSVALGSADRRRA